MLANFFSLRIVAVMLAALSTAALSQHGLAHDTWVEAHTNLIRTGDAVHLSLKLGNHGNDHRDFKLASKISLEGATWELHAPGDQRYDLLPGIVDEGYSPKEGFWSNRFTTGSAGMYTVTHTLDTVVSYAPTRSIKSAKTCFLVSNSLDTVSRDQTGFDRVFGHALELVPVVNPVAPMGPGQPIRVRLLSQGQPLPEAKVSFIPRGAALAEGFDETYESLTDPAGEAEFTPKEGNVYLIVAHHSDPQASGEGYTSTKYSATLTVFVPQVCPCCGE